MKNKCDWCTYEFPTCNGKNIVFGIDKNPNATGKEADIVLQCDSFYFNAVKAARQLANSPEIIAHDILYGNNKDNLESEYKGFKHFSNIEYKVDPVGELFFSTEEQLNSVAITHSNSVDLCPTLKLPNTAISICSANNQVGKVFVNDKEKLEFEGDLEESAKKFFEFFCNYGTNIIKEKNKYISELENVLHRLHFTSQVSMDYDKVKDIMSAISNWSYAHRCGNGEPSEEEQQRMVDHAFEKLKNL